MSPEKSLVGRVSNVKFLIVLAMIGLYAAGTTFYVLGDTSVRGLTVKLFYVSRTCTAGTGIFASDINYSVQAGVWSTQSMKTTVSNVRFTLFADGVNVGTVDGENRSFDPGKSTSFTISFDSQHIDPENLPASSTLVLTINAVASAGFSSSSLTRSDTVTQVFGSTSC